MTKHFIPAWSVVAMLTALAAAPASADTLERLDWMSKMTGEESWGLQLARDQAARDEFLEAIATLERVLASRPEAREAQLLHASLLCRVDDPEGAAMEFSLLHERDFAKDSWAEAHAPCQATSARK